MYNPLKIVQSELPPNLLLMCKLFILLLLTHGFIKSLNDPFIPFIPLLDFFNLYPGVFKITFRAIFIISGLMILFNIKVRYNCIVLGSLIIIGLLASKPLFRNHLFIIGCVILLTGLSNNKEPTKLIVLQLSLLYFSALLSKISDNHWWSGQFMHNWLSNALENPYYLFISEYLPKMWFAKFLSWSSMLIELSIGITILNKKFRKVAIWVIIIFHITLYSFVGTRFGYFMDDIFIILIAFLAWPKSQIKVFYSERIGFIINWFLKIFDRDRIFVFEQSNADKNKWLSILYEDNRKETNIVALRSLILYNPGFYILIFLIISIITFIEMNHYLRYFITLIILWGSIIFFAPFEKLKIKQHN